VLAILDGINRRARIRTGPLAVHSWDAPASGPWCASTTERWRPD
jgi:hypothetical protein